jgi:ferredoxin
VKANYGYADGSGEYYLTVDTDLCNGCGDCVPVCPKGILEVIVDDYDEPKAAMKAAFARSLADACPGYQICAARQTLNCHGACPKDAIRHSW